jgi:hypothetical protein
MRVLLEMESATSLPCSASFKKLIRILWRSTSGVVEKTLDLKEAKTTLEAWGSIFILLHVRLRA